MLQITYFDDETKQQVTREMNAVEKKQHEKDMAEFASIDAEREARKKARLELLDRLGLTEDEARLLLG
jgi:hypothetical protein